MPIFSLWWGMTLYLDRQSLYWYWTLYIAAYSCACGTLWWLCCCVCGVGCLIYCVWWAWGLFHIGVSKFSSDISEMYLSVIQIHKLNQHTIFGHAPIPLWSLHACAKVCGDQMHSIQVIIMCTLFINFNFFWVENPLWSGPLTMASVVLG